MQQISIYQVEDTPIGSGGMGRVFKGYAPDGTPVAIKEILPEFVTSNEYRMRIEHEIMFLQKLDSPHIVKTYNHFQVGDRLYIVMDYVDGVNVEQYVQQNNGPIPLDQAINYMLKILETMQYVHEQNVVHRDIKPSNIMIKSNGDICLLDFGIAKDMNNVGRAGGTIMGTVLGTDGYMSPEQADGMSIDHRSDIYSLACVFYFMITAHHAYVKLGSEVETAINIVNTPFPRISKYVKGIPSSIQEVMDRATDKNMLRRYQSCREFRSDLMKVSGIGTQVEYTSDYQPLEFTISVGRENCDLIVGMDNFKVSRHHADITFKPQTGRANYFYKDCSSNGTLIDGRLYTRGMTCPISTLSEPKIYLAGDASCRLNWQEVVTLLEEKVKNYGPIPTADDMAANISPAQPQPDTSINQHIAEEATSAGEAMSQIKKTSSSMSMMEAVKTCFSKYCTFKGRAKRAEFWYFVLFNYIVQIILYVIGMGVCQDLNMAMILSGIYGLAVFLPGLAVNFRRLHDLNKGIGTFLLLLVGCCIPIVNIGTLIYMIVLYCSKGTDGPNDYD